MNLASDNNDAGNGCESTPSRSNIVRPNIAGSGLRDRQYRMLPVTPSLDTTALGHSARGMEIGFIQAPADHRTGKRWGCQAAPGFLRRIEMQPSRDDRNQSNSVPKSESPVVPSMKRLCEQFTAPSLQLVHWPIFCRSRGIPRSFSCVGRYRFRPALVLGIKAQ